MCRGKGRQGRHVKRPLFFCPLMTWDALRKHCTHATMRHEETKSRKEDLTEI